MASRGYKIDDEHKMASKSRGYIRLMSIRWHPNDKMASRRYKIDKHKMASKWQNKHELFSRAHQSWRSSEAATCIATDSLAWSSWPKKVHEYWCGFPLVFKANAQKGQTKRSETERPQAETEQNGASPSRNRAKRSVPKPKRSATEGHGAINNIQGLGFGVWGWGFRVWPQNGIK